MSEASKRPSRPTFMDLYLKGERSPEDIDDFVDDWHERPGEQELHQFLGMTTDEYASWVRDPGALQRIAEARRTNPPLVGAARRA